LSPNKRQGLLAAAAAIATGVLGNLADTTDVSAAAPTAPAKSATVGEVIVTAQHREERLRDVPLSITSKTGAQLEAAGLQTIKDLTTVTPGLKIDQVGAGFVVPAVRGVSTGLTGAGAEPNVAIYIDGVYQPNSIKLNLDLADVSRVEVDKGPQGTLFGRNATGGAISIFTQDPTFKPGGYASVSYGSYHDRELKGYVEGPITDKLAGSLSAYYEAARDYYFNLLTGGHDRGLESQVYRGKLLYRPNDWFDATLTFSYLHKFDGGGANGEPYNGNTELATVPGVIIPRFPWQIALNYGVFTNVRSYDTSLRVRVHTDAGTLTSLTAYNDTFYHVLATLDFAWVPNPTLQKNDLYSPEKTIQQEFNFASRHFGKFSFIAGLFLWHDETGWDPIIDNNVVYLDYIKHTTSVAGYGEGTYAFTDRLSLIAGVRYSYEKQATKEAVGINGRAPVLPPFTDAYYHSITPRVSLMYKVSDNLNAYFTYSEGFKSGEEQGNVNPAGAGVVGGVFVIPFSIYSIKPETIQAYEIGLKGAWRRVSFNAAAYYYDYKNQQVPTYVVQQGVQTQVVTNAAASSIYGLDFDANLNVTRDLNLTLGLSVLDAKYDQFLAQVDKPIYAEVGGELVPAGNEIVPQDVSGNTMMRAPKWTLTLAADYHHTFDFGTITGNITMFHTDRIYFDPAERLSQPPYTTLNLRLAWRPTDTNLEIALWGRNLSDVAYISGADESTASDGVNYGPPRTFGVQVSYHY
jgi:iron complex outermembrane receptor protein